MALHSEAQHPDGAAARLRADIDRGLTGDKVDWPDPAAAPLGTDDEAAGSRLPADGGEQARAAENARRPAAPHRNDGPGAAWVLIAFILFGVAALIVWVLV